MGMDGKSRAASRIDADIRIIKFLIESEGISRTIRFMQYAIEQRADEIARPQNDNDPATAALYLKALEALEAPYEQIKNEYKL